MAWVQPLVGHLLSQYAETRLEGLQKLKRMLLDPEEKAAAANTYVADSGALQALLAVSSKASTAPGSASVLATAGQDQRLQEDALRVLKLLMESSTGSNRLLLARTLCGKSLFPMIRAGLMDISDQKLQVTLLSLSLLAAVARHCPRVVLGRFHGEVPLSLPCFRSQLNFSVRRVRQARLEFLVSLATGKHLGTTKVCLKTPQFLTQLMEDAAELLRQGDEGGTMETVTAVLDVVEHHFLKADWMDVAEKRETVMNQRGILKILVKAMKLDSVGDRAAAILKFMVDSFQEPSRDYAMARTDADDKGMPNFGVFTIIRLLKPHQSAREAGLLCYTLQQCPDLIRPYFVRCSREMVEQQKGGASEGLMEAVAVVNTMTRAMMAPLPYHLSEHAGSLAPSDASTNRFFSLTPQNAAEEVCPLWLGEFVHKLINHNDNLLLLAWAMQLTQAALNRALHVAALIRQIHAQQHQRAAAAAVSGASKGAALGSFDMTPTTFANDSAASFLVDIDAYETEMTQKLATFLPRREEFWHRVTQQLHATLLLTDTKSPQHAKGQFIMQRMAVLMSGYTDLFRLRVPWLSVLPTFTPVLEKNASITSILRARSDVVLHWEPKTVSSLCSLLCANLARGVALSKLHHVTLGNVSGGQPLLSEWPMLLSLLLWFIRHRDVSASSPDVSEALAYICRLTLLCVHTVSTRYSAEMDEVFLWLGKLTEETAPCLLHVINLMFMRGTSKAAERVAAESANAEFGILVENAKLLVKNTREKKQQKAAEAAAGAPAKSSRPNLWQLDLEANLDSFEKLAQTMESAWGTRSAQYGKTAASIAQHATSISAGKKRLEVAVMRETSAVVLGSSVDASYGGSSPASLHRLLMRHLTVQHRSQGQSDATSSISDDAPSHPDVLAQWQRVHASASFKDLQKLLCKDREMAGAWMSSAPLAWAVVRRIGALVSPDSHKSSASTAADEETAAAAAASCDEGLRQVVDVELPAFARKLLSFLVTNRDVWAPQQTSEAEASRTPLQCGLLVLVLMSLETVLRESKQRTASFQPLDAAVSEGLTDIALSRYTGSLRVVDRVCYAVLLLLHYLDPDGAFHAAAAQPDGAASDDESDTSAVESSSSSDDEEGAAAAAKNDEAATAIRKAVAARKKRRTAHGGVVVSGCMCPKGLVDRRFVTAGVALNSRVTPEIDVLHQLVDAMTDHDANRLDLPLTLTTSVFVKSTETSAGLKSVASGVLASVWALIFPDMPSAKDRAARHALPTAPAHISEDAADPRYVLPLAVTVGSIGTAHPKAVPPHIITRCFSMALRAMSSTCPQQRRMASTVLACCYPSLAPMKRSLLNFTRLRLLHLEAALVSRGVIRRDAAAPLRLPASLTSFLVLAQEPLQRYQHPLHNHMVNYFDNEAKRHVSSSHAAGNAVPMGELLTAFPLGCITHTLVRTKEEALLSAAHHPSAAARKGDVVTAGRTRLIETLQATEPVHLDFVLSILKHSSSGVQSDTAALLASHALSNMMTLFTMSSAAHHVRMGVLDTLRNVCLASGSSAWSCAVEGQVMPWICATLTMLAEESQEDLESGSGASLLFIGLLQLAESMLHAMKAASTVGSTAHHRQLQNQLSKVRVAMLALRQRLKMSGISSKATWDAVSAVEALVASQSH